MRLTVASTLLLSQSLPGSSASGFTGVELNSVTADSSRNVFRTITQDGPQLPTRRTDLPGLITNLDRTTLLKNKPSIRKEDSLLKECNPNSEDPDVGILSCGDRQFCEESPNSKLGGVCYTIVATRELSSSQRNTSYFCNNTHQQYLHCDCTNLNETTNAGTITCAHPYHCNGCPPYCSSYNLQVAFSSAENASIGVACLYLMTPYAVKVCYSYAYGTGACVYAINGVDCQFCNSTYFDCTNIPHGLKGTNTYSSYALPILRAFHGLNPNTTCPPQNAPSRPPTAISPTTMPTHATSSSIPPNQSAPSGPPYRNTPSMTPHASRPTTTLQHPASSTCKNQRLGIITMALTILLLTSLSARS